MVADDVRAVMQPKVKVILFDWGGVLSSGGTPDEMSIRLEGALTMSRHAIRLFITPLLAKLKRGQLSIDEFWTELELHTARKIPFSSRDVWASLEELRPNSELQSFTNSLLAEGYIVGILSNVFPNTEKIIHEAGWYEPYNPLFLSSRLGMAKPDQEIYTHVCTSLGVQPQEILFIDDQQRCLDTAKVIGMRVVLARHPHQIINDIRKVLKAESVPFGHW
ncbi:MAG: HAD-IA family hydrolase [Candidatus Saccharimonadales bacterium]